MGGIQMQIPMKLLDVMMRTTGLKQRLKRKSTKMTKKYSDLWSAQKFLFFFSFFFKSSLSYFLLFFDILHVRFWASSGVARPK